MVLETTSNVKWSGTAPLYPLFGDFPALNTIPVQLSSGSAIFFLMQFGTFERTRQLIKELVPDQSAATFPGEECDVIIVKA